MLGNTISNTLVNPVSKNVKVANINSNNTNIYSFLSSELFIQTSPAIGDCVVGTLPSSYYSNTFSSTVIPLVDKNNNYISLPTTSNTFLIGSTCFLEGVGPETGIWTTPDITIGTISLADPTTLVQNIGGNNLPFSANIPFSDFASGTNKYTCCFETSYVGPPTLPGQSLRRILLVPNTTNILAIKFGGTITTPGKGTGNLRYYFRYFTF